LPYDPNAVYRGEALHRGGPLLVPLTAPTTLTPEEWSTRRAHAISGFGGISPDLHV